MSTILFCLYISFFILYTIFDALDYVYDGIGYQMIKDLSITINLFITISTYLFTKCCDDGQEKFRVITESISNPTNIF